MSSLHIIAPVALLSVFLLTLLFGHISLYFIEKSEQKKLDAKWAVRDESLSSPFFN